MKTIVTAILLSLAASPALLAETMLLTGEVHSPQGQEIIVPLTTNWSARISKMAAEGSYVEEGDIVVEFDGSDAARQLEQQEVTNRGEAAKTKRDLVRLEKEVAQAEFGLKQAGLSLELAEMNANIPGDFIGALEHAENQLAHERAITALEDAKNLLADKREAMRERQRQASLDKEKNTLSEEWWRSMLDTFVIRARQSGYVIYGNHPWTRAKFQEGDSVQTSFRVAHVANTEALSIKVYINGIDRPGLSQNVDVNVFLDTMPERGLSGRLVSISDSGSKRQEWGNALYYEGRVEFTEAELPDLLPGMSVRVEVQL